MGLDTERKREELKKVYPKSESWAHKVTKMSERQVTAIYLKFQTAGKLGK